MNIVFATSEAYPFAKTGGLADVSSSLPRALARRGHKVSVIMPFYKKLMAGRNLKYHGRHELLGVPMGHKTEWAQILEHRVEKNLTFYFIEFDLFFDRPSLYDWNGNEYSDNGERFIFLSRAVMQAMLALKLKPDILHTNDWHTALCNVYLHSALYWNFDNFKNCRSVLTIHNIGYQGVYHKSNMYWTGLGWEYFTYLCMEFYDQMNLLKAGIMTADMVNTVSPTYAREILSPDYSFNMQDPLRHCAARGKLRGILNGICVDEWNPRKDEHIPANYTEKDITGKAACKRELQKIFSLPQRPDVPVFGMITRLAYQKGVDVFCAALEKSLPVDDYQHIIIGAGENWIQDWLNSLASRYPTKLAVYIGYSQDSLAHILEAGSDFYVMPSRYEPCGLNQMYSMAYGTLPIVRATGGLDDTVQNFNTSDIPGSTGFKLWDLNTDSLLNTMRWAADTYHQNPWVVEQMRKNGMRKDFSWNHTAAEYERLYEDAH